MKKLLYVLVAMLAVVLSTSSCVSSKKIVYFQGADTLFAQAQDIIQQYEMRLKPADQVLIKISCTDPELLEVFAQDVTVGSFSTGGSSMNMNTSGSMTNAYGYTVTNEGTLMLPAIGEVRVDGMTTDEAAAVIERKIKDAKLVPDPEVTVRLLNARVAVVGAVKSPKVVSLTSERSTIIDILAQCSDVADASLRQHVKLFREENGERKMYELDLTKSTIFNSPAFYVQQNDMIYVEPNKSQSIRSSAFYTFLGAGSSILALVTTAISLVFLLKKN